MLKIKKILFLTVALCMCFSALAPCVSAQEKQEYATREYIVSEFVQSVGRNTLVDSEAVLGIFTDSENISDEYRKDISRAVVGGILKGYEDRTIRPDEPVSRLEAMVMLARCVPSLEETSESVEFTDVPEWAKDEIDYLSKAGLVKGYGDGRMGADDLITTEQVALLVERSDEALRMVEPGDSFYGYVNEKKFRNANTETTTEIDVIHGTVVTKQNAWSHFNDVENLIKSKENEILTKIINGEIEVEKGTPEQRVRDMLECIVSDEIINDEDKKNIEAMRKAILDTKTIEEFLSVTADIYKLAGINVAFDISIDVDKETGIPYPLVALAPTGSGGFIAARTTTDTPEHKQLYAELIANYLKAIGADFEESDIKSAIELQIICAKSIDLSTMIDSVLAIGVSNGSISPEEAEKEHWDMVKRKPDFFDLETGKTFGTNHVFESKSKDEADASHSGFDLCKELERYGFTNLEKIIIPKSSIAELQKDVISETNLNAIKINAILRLEEILNIALTDEEKVAHERLALFTSTFCLSKSADEARERIMTVNGSDTLVTLTGSADKNELSPVNLDRLVKLLPNDIGLIYTKYFYDDETSYVIVRMLNDIGMAYIERFLNNEWMDDQTKENAILKLENMLGVIGYPDNYTFPEIIPMSEGGSLFSNTLSINRHNVADIIRKNEEKQFLRTQMLMMPDSVNAGYIAQLNTINIPAGILNPPFYDPSASYEANLGAIGIIIAHEIGHAFDAKGSQYDENGCLKNWWTEDDAKEFAALQEKFIEYYSKFEVVDGVVQDSKLTIGENMADFAAMQIVMDVVGDDKEKQKECLESYANFWATLGSVSHITRESAMTDVHSRSIVRVNAIVASVDAFYEIYGIDENDKMYVAPEDRLQLL